MPQLEAFMSQKLASIIISYRSLPLWVQIWVGFLVIVNSLWIGLLDTPTGQATAWAALFVVLTNGPLVWAYAGMNRVLSIPHLFAWIPLQVFLAQHLWRNAEALSQAEYAYAALLLVVNGISLAFDVVDSWRWLKGERETPGLPLLNRPLN